MVSVLGENGLFGWVCDSQTLDSVFVDMFPASSPSALRRKMEMSEWEGLADSGFDEASGLSGYIVDFLRTISSLRPEMDDVRPVLEAARKYLPVDDAEALNKMVEKNMNVRDSLSSLLSSTNDEATQAARICRILVQMLVTKLAVRRVLQMATPESVFAAR